MIEQLSVGRTLSMVKWSSPAGNGEMEPQPRSDSSQFAVRKHRKKVARIVCDQWLYFSRKRLIASRHRRLCLLLYGLLAFKAALSRQQRLAATLSCMKAKRRFLALITSLARWQQFVSWQKAMNRKRVSLVKACIAQLQGRLVTKWCTHIVEMKWLAVCEAKAAFFSRFMRMSSVVRALKSHRLRRRTKRLSHGITVQHNAQTCKRGAWQAWNWAVHLQRHKKARYSTARHFARQRCLQAVLTSLSSHCTSRKRARSAFLACLRSIEASIQHQALRCACRDWLSLAHMQRVLKANLVVMQQFSRSLTLRAGVSKYVPAQNCGNQASHIVCCHVSS